jgi:mono/diheme cytochrome c family protein
VKRFVSLAAALCAILMTLATPFTGQAAENRSSAAGAGSPAAARGQYLVTILACNDCHTPFKMGPKGPEPDMTRMLSGHPETMKMPKSPAPAGPWIWFGAATNTAYAGPWGVSYAANLTPDQNTGLGIWTEDMFVKAMRTGKHMATSREILPPMPWPSFGKMTDADLKAVYAYLKTVPPITNHVPDAEVVPPPGASHAAKK